jgi:translocation protein SEC63
MVALPTVVGFWWYRSIRYSSDAVLLDTTQLYYYFFHKTPSMMLKRALMILAASMEFEPSHAGEMKSRPSDNEQVPLVRRKIVFKQKESCSREIS